MTRADILKDYEVNEYGIITSPGKFAGEMVYVPYFYAAMMEGGADDTEYEGDKPIDIFNIRRSDIDTFPELEGTYRLYLWESDQGFVYTHETPVTD